MGSLDLYITLNELREIKHKSWAIAAKILHGVCVRFGLIRFYTVCKHIEVPEVSSAELRADDQDQVDHIEAGRLEMARVDVAQDV